MKTRIETRIAVRPSPATPARKLTKVITYKNGGFGVVMPYHQSRSGFVAKMPVDYNQIGDFELNF